MRSSRGTPALRTRVAPGTRYGAYWLALGLISAAAVCSALDVTRVWCDPDDHWIQGHAAWHLLSAASLLALYYFYAGLRAAPR